LLMDTLVNLRRHHLTSHVEADNDAD